MQQPSPGQREEMSLVCGYTPPLLARTPWLPIPEDKMPIS